MRGEERKLATRRATHARAVADLEPSERQEEVALRAATCARVVSDHKAVVARVTAPRQ